MGNINYSKVLMGGLVAFVVFFALDYLGYMYILGMDMPAWLARHSLHEPPMWTIFFIDLMFGLMVVWLYAAIRPRFGPGVKTALTAAAFMWVFFTVAYFSFHMMGLFTPADYAKSAGWGAIQLVAATLAGAWVYREGSDAAPRM